MNRGFRYSDRIAGDSAGKTVLAFYVARYPHSSETEWHDRIDHGAVLLDGETVAADTVLQAGQTLEYDRAPWTEPPAPATFGVIYEDRHIIVVDKPSGLPVLPGGLHLENTLLARVRERFGGDVAPSPLHRLGRGTSGIVLFARTDDARRRLTRAFAERKVTKIYRALVRGVGLRSEQTIDVPIGRVDYPPTGTLYAAKSDGASSRSLCRLLCEDREHCESLVEVSIVTGRPHQIRIHAAAIGYPLVGDPLYVAGGGPGPLVTGLRAPLPGDCGYHLHATHLAFRHPASGEPLHLYSRPPTVLQIPDESIPAS